MNTKIINLLLLFTVVSSTVFIFGCAKDDENEPIGQFPTGFGSQALPANKAQKVNLNTTLSWDHSKDPDGGVVLYDVYFDSIFPPKLLSKAQKDNYYKFTTPLKPNKKYYWKVNAKDPDNNKITFDYFSFTTRPEFVKGSEVILGDTYGTITIGSQTWTTENLKYVTPSSSATSDAAYGRLYNLTDVQNLVIPAGWRLPTEADFLVLSSYFPHERMSDGNTGLSGPKQLATGAGNSGFNAILGGVLNASNVITDSNEAWFWTKNDSGGSSSYLVYRLTSDSFGYGTLTTNYKYSIRLIKN